MPCLWRFWIRKNRGEELTSQEKQKLLERMRRNLLELTHGESNPHVNDLALLALEALSKLLFLIGRQEANE